MKNKKKYQVSIDWTVIQKFGNSSFGKLVVLAPLIAQAVYYSSEFFTQHLGIEKILWLYWSLIFIFLGQVVYLIYCPEEIKRYGSDSTTYIIETLDSLDSHKMNFKFNLWLQWHFNNSSTHSTGYKPEDGYYRSEKLQGIASMPEDRENVKKSLPEEMKMEYHKVWKHVMDYYAYHGHDNEVRWEIVRKIYREYPASFGSEHASTSHPLNLRGSNDDKRWKIETLTWFYNRTKMSHVKARYVILTLYGIGAIYFIWHSLITLSRMINITFGTILMVVNS